MPYRIRTPAKPAEEILRAAREQVGRAVGEIDNADLSPADTVHQVRKRCKKIRALARLARGPLEDASLYKPMNAHFRDVARMLSDHRDADVMLSVLDGLAHRVGGSGRTDLTGLRETLADRRRPVPADTHDALSEARLLLVRGRDDLLGENVLEAFSGGRGFDAVSEGLAKTYRRAREAMPTALDTRDSDDLHEWRKRAKYHYYHCKLLRATWPALMKSRQQESKRLADLLGDDHDLAVLADTLRAMDLGREHQPAVEDALQAISRRRAQLQSDAQALGERLFAEKPGQLQSRFQSYWHAWADAGKRKRRSQTGDKAARAEATPDASRA